MRTALLLTAGVASAAFSSLAPSPAHAQDSETASLEPASDWKLREYDDKCRASRNFGTGEDAVTLWLDQGGAQQIYNLTLLGEPFANPYGGGIRIKPGDEKELIRSYLTLKSSKGRPVLRMYGLTLVQPEMNREGSAERPDISLSEARAAAIDTLTIGGAGLKSVQLDLGPMGAPLAFLKDCGRRLEIALSSRMRALGGEARPPQPIGQDDWLQVSDWPAYLRRAEMEGQITVRLTVNAKGSATSCNVIGSNKPQLFDDAVCLGLMRRSKFEPALDGDAEPVASYFVITTTFRFR